MLILAPLGQGAIEAATPTPTKPPVVATDVRNASFATGAIQQQVRHVRLCEGFRMPGADGGATRMGGRRRKTSKGGNRGKGGRRFVTRYGDLSAANGACD